MRSVPSAVADGCLVIADWQDRNPSATADGTDLNATAKPLTRTHRYLRSTLKRHPVIRKQRIFSAAVVGDGVAQRQ